MLAQRVFFTLLIAVSVIAVTLMAAKGFASKAPTGGEEPVRQVDVQARLTEITETTETTDKTMPVHDDELQAAAKEELTPEQYNVCFLKGTEPPGSGEYYKHFEPGVYHCAVCKEALFASDTKYDSGSGWPAFYDAVDSDAVATHTDNSLGMRRIEITCAKCGSHLGHVFDDGPAPTGQRYCVNSLSLEFVADGEKEK